MMLLLLLVLSLFLPWSVSDAATRYADSTITTCGTYSIANRNCSGSDGNAYTTIQAAVTAASAGDTIYIRAGTYTFAANTEVLVSTVCTAGAPCTLSGYQNEVVTLRGAVIYPAADAANALGRATGPVDPTDRAKLIHVTGNYWTVTKLILENSGWYGCEIGGSNNTFIEMIVRHNWATGCQTVTGANNNTFKYMALHHTRHGSGLEVTVSTDDTVGSTGNRFERTLAFKNGMDATDTRVLNYPGPGGEGTDPISDPGGANSDGLGSDKGCAENSLGNPRPTNLCTGTVILENLVWKNQDDCIDVSIGYSWIIGNFVSDCGPEGLRGFKVFFNSAGIIFSGNLCYAAQDNCNEPQASDPIKYINNAAIVTPGFGFRVVPLNTLTTSIAVNNISYGNGADYDWASIGTVSNNLNTNPGLVNIAVSLSYTTPESDAGFPATTIQSRWQALWDQVEANFKAAGSGSVVVNAGILVSGYHCALADDNGQDVNAACRHWKGSAPDIGPFEFGIAGNPDKTKSVVSGAPAAPTLSIQGTVALTGKVQAQ